MHKVYIVLSSLIVLGLVIFSATTSLTDAASNEAEVVVDEPIINVYVEIKGAVVNPGIYEFNNEVRVFEVIEEAGGLLASANIDYINQTRIVSDQMLIIILTNEEIVTAIEQQELLITKASTIIETPSNQTEIIGYDHNFCSVPKQAMISLNQATLEELLTLPGIGKTKANAILAYRSEHGAFTSLDELLAVDGIGQATFDTIKVNLTL